MSPKPDITATWSMRPAFIFILGTLTSAFRWRGPVEGDFRATICCHSFLTKTSRTDRRRPATFVGIGLASSYQVTSVFASIDEYRSKDVETDVNNEGIGTPHGMIVRSSEMITPLTSVPSADITSASAPMLHALHENNNRSPVYHIVLEHSGAFRFSEGQSVGIRPPGLHPRSGRPHPPRLYSIASHQRGDDGMGNTISLCVARVGWNKASPPSASGRPYGLCSEFLCTAAPGTKVLVTDPIGRNVLDPNLLRESGSTVTSLRNPKIDAIFVATGTGIAPFRSMILGLFRNNQDASNTLAKYAATSRCLLYFGSASKESLLYKHELDEIQRLYPNQFQYHCALSREPGLPKTYVQDLLKRDVSPIIDRLRRGAHIYFSGYKDMITGIKQVLKEALCNSSASDDSEYINFINVLKAENRWHSETYV